MASVLKKLSEGYGYKYTELSTIHEELEKQNITYYQYIEYDAAADADYIYTVLNYDGDEKAPRRGCRVVLGDTMKSAAQEQGSALTYARRYSLLMSLGWATEDDDGDSVGKKTKMPSRNKIDFRQVREHLNEITSVDELNSYWVSLNLTEKQAGVLKKDFADRKVKIGVGVGV
jgi:hypothetical protein